MSNTVRQFLRDERGATAIEYALIAVLLGTALITALTGLGNALSSKFTAISTSLSTTH